MIITPFKALTTLLSKSHDPPSRVHGGALGEFGPTLDVRRAPLKRFRVFRINRGFEGLGC